MSFDQPIWLFLTPILLLCFTGLYLYGFRHRDALLRRFAASRLIDQLTEKISTPRSWLKHICILLALLAIGLGLARPQWGFELSERKARGLDIIFAVDASRSMLATDIRPSRLHRARLAVLDLLNRLESDRVGIVAFAGKAFLQTPLTLDYSAFREGLDLVGPDMMTLGGTNLSLAINEATEAFPSDSNVKVIILLTDGEDLGSGALEAARSAHQKGVQIFTIGIGTPEGTYLRIPNEAGTEEFVRDASGQPVRTQLDEATLVAIAEATNGRYSPLDNQALNQLFNSVLATLPREERRSEFQEIPIERFQWLLSFALLLLVSEIFIRRRKASTLTTVLLAFTFLPPSPSHAEALSRADLTHHLKTAHESLLQRNYLEAIEAYELAIAQSNDLPLQRDALYNMGHAQYQLGLQSFAANDPQIALDFFKKAEALFESAHQIDPADQVSRDDFSKMTQVRQTLEEWLEQQPPPAESPDQQEDNPDQPPPDQDENASQDDAEQDGEGADQDSASAEHDPSQDDASQNPQDESLEQPSPSDDPSGNSKPSGSDQSDRSDDSQKPASEPTAPEENSQNYADDESTSTDSSEETIATESDPSKADPVDDIPHPAPSEDTDSPTDVEATQQTDEEAPGEEPATTEDTSGVLGEESTNERMTEIDAAALLDSLRGRERLLPFHQPTHPGQSNVTRDW